jgi:hypothetical protein
MALFTLADASKQMKEFIDTSDLKRVAAKEYLHNLSSEKLLALLTEVLTTNGIEFCDNLKEGWLCMDMLVEEMIDLEENVVDDSRIIHHDGWSCPTDGMVHLWQYKGKQYLRNSDNEVWLKGEDGGCGEWQGMFKPTEDRIDDSIAEPVFADEAEEADEDNTVRWTKKTVDALRHRRADGMVQPWVYKGTQYLRNSHNEVWLKGKDGGLGEWQGVYLPTKDRFHSLAEPMVDYEA